MARTAMEEAMAMLRSERISGRIDPETSIANTKSASAPSNTEHWLHTLLAYRHPAAPVTSESHPTSRQGYTGHASPVLQVPFWEQVRLQGGT